VNIKIYDDLIPKHLQDYYELSILGRTSVEEEIMHPTVDLRCKYESTANEEGYNPLSFVHVLKSSSQRSNHLDNFALIPQVVCQDLGLILKEIIYSLNSLIVTKIRSIIDFIIVKFGIGILKKDKIFVIDLAFNRIFFI
jgi:hypothetical protein